MSNSFKPGATHFSRGEKNFLGGFAPFAALVTGLYRSNMDLLGFLAVVWQNLQ